MENTKEVLNGNGNVAANIKIARLKTKVSFLRAVVYIILATLVLFTCLVVFWIHNYYYFTSPFETYYSKPPGRIVAYLYLSPQRGNYQVGEEFQIDVLINTAGSNVVASAAYISYDKKKTEALSIDVTGSAFNMVAEKEIIAEDGKIKITLGKPTPGIVTFRGNNVRMATVRFRALEKTSPVVDNIYFDFTKGSSNFSTVILDDKRGTNILDDTRGSKIFIE